MISIIVCAVLGVVTFFGVGNQQTVYNVMTGPLRYATIAADYAVPVIALVCTFVFGKKRGQVSETLYEQAC